MCTASILTKISVHSSDFVQKKIKNKLVGHRPFSKILVGGRPNFWNWSVADQCQKFWLATDQRFKNGCSPTNLTQNGRPPTKFWKMVAHRPILKIFVGHRPLSKKTFVTNQIFKNGRSPTTFKRNGWPPTNFFKNGRSPTTFKKNGWPPTEFWKMVAAQPLWHKLIGHRLILKKCCSPTN